MKYCKSCNYSFADNQNFCTECGGKLDIWGNVCSNCQTAIVEGASFCTNCGMQTGATACQSVANANISSQATASRKIPYFSFAGRISLGEYWLSYFKLSAIFIVLYFSMTLIPLMILGDEGIGISIMVAVLGPTILLMIFSALVLSFAVRRLHDLGYAWTALFNPFKMFQPFYKDGMSGDNQYGPDPKARR